MIVTKFHENRSTIDREINEKHAILVDTFNVTFFGPDPVWVWGLILQLKKNRKKTNFEKIILTLPQLGPMWQWQALIYWELKVKTFIIKYKCHIENVNTGNVDGCHWSNQHDTGWIKTVDHHVNRCPHDMLH